MDTGHETEALASPASAVLGDPASRDDHDVGLTAERLHPCDRSGASAAEIDVERQLQRIASLKGEGVSNLPELSFIRVDTGTEKGALTYTVTKNRELTNVSFMMLEGYRSLPDEDNLTVLHGFTGSYPSYFFSVKVVDLPEFAASMEALRSLSSAS